MEREKRHPLGHSLVLKGRGGGSQEEAGKDYDEESGRLKGRKEGGSATRGEKIGNSSDELSEIESEIFGVDREDLEICGEQDILFDLVQIFMGDLEICKAFKRRKTARIPLEDFGSDIDTS